MEVKPEEALEFFQKQMSTMDREALLARVAEAAAREADAVTKLGQLTCASLLPSCRPVPPMAIIFVSLFAHAPSLLPPKRCLRGAGSSLLPRRSSWTTSVPALWLQAAP